MTEQQNVPSERLKKIIEEVSEVLEKHDVAGFIALHEPGAGEYKFCLSPSYSCATLDEESGVVRLKAKVADHNGDRQKVIQLQSDTANMLYILGHMTAEQSLNLIDLSEHMDKVSNVEHG